MSRDNDESMNPADDAMFKTEWDADGHIGEDSVYAWLDGQLGESDADLIEVHIRSCAVCAELVAEARGIKAATTRIVGALDVVPSGIVSRDDVARTASRIVSMANSVNVAAVPPAKSVGTPLRFWQNRAFLRAAAAILVVAGGSSWLVVRGPAFKESAAADSSATRVPPVTSLSAPAPAASSSMPAPPAQSPTPVRSTRANEMLARDAVAGSGKSSAGARRKAPLAEEVRANALALDSNAEKRAKTLAAAGPPAAAQAPLVRREARTALTTADSANVAKLPLTVVGIVVERETGRPVAGAMVQIPGTTIGSVTSTLGNFTLSDVPRATSSVLARRLGYQAAQTPLDTIRGDTARIVMTLQESHTALDRIAVDAARPLLASPPLPPSVACALRVTSSTLHQTPLFNALMGRVSELGDHQLTVVGWPAPSDSTLTAFARHTADGLIFRATKNGSQLDVQLVRDGINWSGTANEHGGVTTRKAEIILAPTGGRRCEN